MSIRGIDIAWARPDVGGIIATGAKWVARYFSTDPTKNLTASEVQAYTAAGLDVVTVWETTAGRALQGAGAGISDANAAVAQRAAVGIPSGYPIHFAVDTDTDWASVQSYFSGVCSVLNKNEVGVYGGYAVAQGAHAYGLRYIWQTTAWSNGAWSPAATIRQDGGTVLSGVADLDEAEVPDFGQYPMEEVVTPQDKLDIANLVWKHVETNAQTGNPVEMGAVLAWMDHAHTIQTQAIEAIHAQVAALETAVAALPKT
jgi:hypothetical protein